MTFLENATLTMSRLWVKFSCCVLLHTLERCAEFHLQHCWMVLQNERLHNRKIFHPYGNWVPKRPSANKQLWGNYESNMSQLPWGGLATLRNEPLDIQERYLILRPQTPIRALFSLSPPFPFAWPFFISHAISIESDSSQWMTVDAIESRYISLL